MSVDTHEEQEIDELSKRIRDKTEEIPNNPEVVRKLLISSGIYDEQGNLTKEYK